MPQWELQIKGRLLDEVSRKSRHTACVTLLTPTERDQGGRGQQAQVYVLLQELGGGARSGGVRAGPPPGGVVSLGQHRGTRWVHCESEIKSPFS